MALISFSNLVFSKNTFALYTPTLSASVDNSAISVNGNQVINSTNKTTEIPFNFTVNTNNRTGYTATLSAETENTALTNVGSSAGAKIDSISTDLSLSNLPNNTWGYKFGGSTNYEPIPALSTPAQILKTTEKTNGNESNQLSIGMKLADNLESGNYMNKLLISVVSNSYYPKAILTDGLDFNNKLRTLEGDTTDKIEHFKKSSTPPATTINVLNVEDEDSDYEIKLWLDTTDKTAYYYAITEKVYLNENSSGMFSSYLTDNKLKNILDIDFANFNTSRTTNMGFMFSRMSNLTSLNLSNFDTSKVTNMRGMFQGMSSLTTLDLSNFDTSQVTIMSGVFKGMSNLTSLNISNFNTSNVTDMSLMFAETHKLKTLNLGHMNTSRVTTMEKMFSNMWALENLDVSSFDTSNVTTMKEMFSGVTKITMLNLNNFNTSKVTDMSNMFNSMLAIENLSLPSFDTRKVTTMRSMFATMEGLKNLNISSFDTSSVRDFRYMFGLGDVQNYGYNQIDHLEHIYASKKFVISAMETGGADGIFYRRPSLTVGAGCTYVSGTGNPFCIGSTWVVTS